MRREVEELRTLTRDQEQKVTQTQVELSALEAVLALLHLQEVGQLSTPTHRQSFVSTHTIWCLCPNPDPGVNLKITNLIVCLIADPVEGRELQSSFLLFNL